MTDVRKLEPPAGLDWRLWVERWDRMQERYLVRRAERFGVIARLIGAMGGGAPKIVDLGCGTGSLMVAVLEALLNATAVGVDFDPTILWLARSRLERFGPRAGFALADLRQPSWTQAIGSPADAAVSATALHWCGPDQLVAIYGQVAQVLRPGGLLLNADHVGSDSPAIQREWERRRAEMREEATDPSSDDWDGFWAAYSGALGLDPQGIQQGLGAGWEGGVENGLPLAWHLDRLRESGFSHVDCFWRCDCDAVYGGVRSGNDRRERT